MIEKIYVGNLPWSMDATGLREVFEEFGAIEDAVVIMDKGTNRSKGFGFVTFVDPAAARRAVTEKNASEVEGRTIRVDSARSDSGGNRDRGGRASGRGHRRL